MTALYFFLSHAQAPPFPGQGADPDYWIGRVFNHLCTEVRGRSAAPDRWDIGFLDQLVPAKDRAAEVSRALSCAEVFVPLYSLRYLRDPGAMNARATFRARLGGGWADHILPVLWEPELSGRPVPEFEAAVALAPHLAGYADVGLLGLSRTSAYRDTYEKLLAILSSRIVEVAEGTPIGPASGPVMVDPAGVEPAETVFIVAVLAPTRDDPPRGRRADVYGPRPTQWRPFAPDQELPLAQQSALLRMSGRVHAQVIDFNAERQPFAENPGFLLIDPWILETTNGPARLRHALNSLPRWAEPLVVTNEGDPQYAERGRRLGDEATTLCGAGRERARWRRDVRGADAFDEFVARWVLNANRHYQRLFRPRSSSGPYPRRPRLGAFDS